MTNLSLVLPVHNQADIIEPVYRDIRKTLQKIHITYECILVENGSTDESKNAVFLLAKKYPHTKALTAPIGYGSAVIAGLHKAKGVYVCYMPSDGQIDLSVLPRLWGAINSRTWDMVKVHRTTRETVGRYVFSWCLSHLVATLFGIPALDLNGSPRIFLRTKLTRLALSHKDSFIDIEFAVKAHRLNWKIKEFPMRTLPRFGGTSTRSWRTFVEFFSNIWRYRISDELSSWEQS
ncbi:glycosyltransferase family 2 protein [Candidatus Gottesmanbacteria bacterium]|nr:glycosyltransferase family 2 protein [Candidatus Gottesmanbacteria bacterium]